MCTENWESTYLKLVRIVTNPKKFEKVLKRWNLDKNARVLDLCCGNGGSLKVFQKAGYRNLCGLDISHNLLSRAEVDAPLVRGDAGQCPFGNAAFDVIIIHKALHHFLDLTPLIREVKRILKPGGYFCFIEPRKTWFRTLYHIVLMSPFIEIFPPLLRMRNAALIEEGETYFSWLNNSPSFFKMLEDNFDFRTECYREDLFHYAVKYRNRSMSAPGFLGSGAGHAVQSAPPEGYLPPEVQRPAAAPGIKE